MLWPSWQHGGHPIRNIAIHLPCLCRRHIACTGPQKARGQLNQNHTAFPVSPPKCEVALELDLPTLDSALHYLRSSDQSRDFFTL